MKFIHCRRINHKKTTNNFGFTLIELSIALIIIGLLLSFVFSSLNVFMKNREISETKKKTENIQQAMAKFLISDQGGEDAVRFPCPASLTLPMDHKDFGKERCDLLDKDGDGRISEIEATAAHEVEGLFVVPGTQDGETGLVVIGGLPVHTLGLSSDSALDVYKNRYIYAISLSQIRNEYAALGSNKQEGAITILNEGNGEITQSAPFFIYSTGQDALGGYSSGGVRIAPCREMIEKNTKDAGDAQNCAWQKDGGRAVFRVQLGKSLGQNDQYYDDSAIYTTHMLGEKGNWWQAEDIDGENIYNTNPGKVWIGSNLANIDFKNSDRLVVDGQIRGIDTIHSDFNIIANGRIGVGTDSPRSKLEVDGDIQIGYAGNSCSSRKAGTLRFQESEKALEFCNGEEWQSILMGSIIKPSIEASPGNSYTAETDGIVNATVSASGGSVQNRIIGYVDGQKIGEASAQTVPAATTQGHSSLSFPVPKDSTWRVDAASSGGVDIQWSQLGD